MSQQGGALIETLKNRFHANMARHRSIDWDSVVKRLKAAPHCLKALAEMERTGGEPDLVVFDDAAREVAFCDCVAESPAGRRSLCYDPAALAARKQNKPKGSAVAMAAEMGVELLDEARYRLLQTLGEFDLKTSSWVLTPPEMRALGGALFCDRRFGRVFAYHNGADSYYAARGFRAFLRM